ncbi:sulfatase family protein [Thermoflexibacter ruber]|uniref:Arylsulfatase A n=1 Tax=Thermoflexibacter ruber TaxID=1003 RepID=A0A1I2JMR4_9BACT|nr:sulfatase [Thermoflexibacter ruber]SFF55230.1 Arylsulfatase A [Thermoflexibacter ruber]
MTKHSPPLTSWLRLASFVALLPVLFSFGKKEASKPNILWITCEDMSPRLSAYGDSTVPTPNIDRLAKEGVRYTNMYSVSGVCAPSRSAIITGMYPTSIGSHNMRTLYNTLVPDLPPYSVVTPPEVKCFSEYLRKEGYYCTNNEKTDYQFETPISAWDESSKTAHWRNRRDGQPFFAIFNFTTTHESQVWARKNEPLLFNPKKIKVPSFYPDNEIIRKDLTTFYNNIAFMDTQVGNIIKQLEEDGLLDNTIIFFYSDHGDGLPYAKREVYDRGLKVPFIIRYPDKKGAGTAENELHSFVDLAPSILSLVGIKPPKHLQGQAFLGKYAAKAPRKYIYAARDRMDSEYDMVRAVRDKKFKYIKNYQPEKPFYQNIQYRLQQDMMKEILRLKDEGKLNERQMRWFSPIKPVEELYHVENDPDEFDNLADNPLYQNKLEELRKAHLDWQAKYGDKGFIPEKELVAQMLPNGKQPITQEPKIIVKGDKVKITCATIGASIVYKIENQQAGIQKIDSRYIGRWQVYTHPLKVKKGDKVFAIATRIGFKQSEEKVLEVK